MIREQSEQEQAEEKHAEEEWHKVLLQHYFGEAGINKSEREWQDDFFQDEWAEKELRKILANDKGQTREKKNPKFSENEWQKEHEVDSALGDYDFLRYRCEEEFDPELITDLEEERCKQNLRQYEAEATLDWHEAKDRLENEYFEAGQYLLQAEEPEDEDQAAKHPLDLQEEEWWEIQRQEHLAEEEWREIQRQEHLAEEEWRKIPLHYSDSKFIIYEDE